MWTATIDGFYSAVQHRDNPDLVVVRSRSKADTEALIKRLIDIGLHDTDADYAHSPDGTWIRVGHVIESEPMSDYPWRTYLFKDDWAGYLGYMVEALDYGNFKDAVAKVNPDRSHGPYMKTWQAMLAIEDEKDSGVTRKGWGDWSMSGTQDPLPWSATRVQSLEDVCEEYGLNPEDFIVPDYEPRDYPRRWEV